MKSGKDCTKIIIKIPLLPLHKVGETSKLNPLFPLRGHDMPLFFSDVRGRWEMEKGTIFTLCSYVPYRNSFADVDR